MGRKLTLKEQQKTIFVADGSQTNLWQLIQTLGEDGFRVVVCARANLALQLLEGETPEAILINVTDPLTRWYDLQRTIMHDPRLSRVRVLLMVRHPRRDDGAADGAAARVGYLTLPLDREQVLREIHRGMESPPRRAGAAAVGFARPS